MTSSVICKNVIFKGSHALKTLKIDIISRLSPKPWQLGQNGCQGDTGCLRLATDYRMSQKSEKQFSVSGKYLKNCVKSKNCQNCQKAWLWRNYHTNDLFWVSLQWPFVNV